MPRPKPGTKEMFDRRMRPAKKAVVQKEFEGWISDMAYEALLGSRAMKAYLFEAFVGGWGAKARAVKRRERKT
jgi:hypothetical protein